MKVTERPRILFPIRARLNANYNDYYSRTRLIVPLGNLESKRSHTRERTKNLAWPLCVTRDLTTHVKERIRIICHGATLFSNYLKHSTSSIILKSNIRYINAVKAIIFEQVQVRSRQKDLCLVWFRPWSSVRDYSNGGTKMPMRRVHRSRLWIPVGTLELFAHILLLVLPNHYFSLV